MQFTESANIDGKLSVEESNQFAQEACGALRSTHSLIKEELRVDAIKDGLDPPIYPVIGAVVIGSIASQLLDRSLSYIPPDTTLDYNLLLMGDSEPNPAALKFLAEDFYNVLSQFWSHGIDPFGVITVSKGVEEKNVRKIVTSTGWSLDDPEGDAAYIILF